MLGLPVVRKESAFQKDPKLLKRWIECGQIWWDTHANTGSRKKFANIYELMVHNLFFRTYDKFRKAIDGDLIGENVACKTYLDYYFHVKL